MLVDVCRCSILFAYGQSEKSLRFVGCKLTTESAEHFQLEQFYENYKRNRDKRENRRSSSPSSDRHTHSRESSVSFKEKVSLKKSKPYATRRKEKAQLGHVEFQQRRHDAQQLEITILGNERRILDDRQKHAAICRGACPRRRVVGQRIRQEAAQTKRNQRQCARQTEEAQAHRRCKSADRRRSE